MRLELSKHPQPFSFFFSSRRRHTRLQGDWSSDVCSSDLDEWDMALRIAPDHVGALKGLAFLYFKIGDVQQAAAHLEAAQRVAPDDPGVAQALAMARGGEGGPADAEAVAGGGGGPGPTGPG